MSQSPKTTSDRNAFQPYQVSWQATLKLARSGSSWSGHERNCVYLNDGGAIGLAAGTKDSVGDQAKSNAGINSEKNNNASPPKVARFINASSVSGLDFPDDGRAISAVDWDHDGDLDFWIRNRTAPRLRLMQNGTRRNDFPDVPSNTASSNTASSNTASSNTASANFVSFRLEGVEANRDAIGARVEVSTDDVTEPPRVQTLRAGDAFLSQSSKWVHFGLGNSARDLTVAVQWPGGKRETYGPLAVNAHYRLKQGSGQAVTWKRPSPAKLVARTVVMPELSAAARVVLPGRVPLPSINFQPSKSHNSSLVPDAQISSGPSKDERAEQTPITSANAKTVRVITFWTSTCPNCRRELAGYAGARKRIRDAGLEIVAVCLDSLGDPADTSSGAQNGDAGTAYLDSIQFPFSRMEIDAYSLERLRQFQIALFDQYPDFVVPLSLLVDDQSNVIAIYRGAYSADVFIKDIELATKSDAELRDLAAPLAGSWFTKPANRTDIAEFVGRKFSAHDPDESLRYFELAAAVAVDKNRKAALTKKTVDMHLRRAAAYAQNRNYDKSIEHLEHVLRLTPNHEGARKNLEVLRSRQ